MPAMATDCERSFSLAKLAVTSQRLSMSTETLEKLQCLKNWVRHGAVKVGTAAGGGAEFQWEIGKVVVWGARKLRFEIFEIFERFE